MIIRYTTPYHNFVLPFKVDEIAELDITYSQNGKEICTKSKADVTITDIEEIITNASIEQEGYINAIVAEADNLQSSSVVKLRLTQEETSRFTFYRAEEKNIALVQVRILHSNDDSFVSRPIKIRVYGSLTEGVL
jgi:hypothetical protein